MAAYHYCFHGKLNSSINGNIVQAAGYPFPLAKETEFKATVESNYSPLPSYISTEESLNLIGDIINFSTTHIKDLDFILVRLNLPIWVRLLPVLFHEKVLLCQDHDALELENIIEMHKNVMVIDNKLVTHFQENGDNTILIDLYSFKQYQDEFEQLVNLINEKGIYEYY